MMNKYVKPEINISLFKAGDEIMTEENPVITVSNYSAQALNTFMLNDRQGLTTTTTIKAQKIFEFNQ